MIPALLLAMVVGCGGVDCPRGVGVARDECLASQAGASFARDPEGALALATQIGDDALRDLVILEGVRSSERDFCEHILDRGLRRSCDTTISRPHLREFQQQEASAARAEQVFVGLDETALALVEPCAGYQGATLEQCVSRVAQRSADTHMARQLCQALPTADIQGQCLVTLSQKLSREGVLEEAAAVCDAIAHPRWQAECRFRLSEELPSDAWRQAAGLCRQAGEFADECTFHLLARQTLERVRLLEALSFRQAIQALEADLAELDPVLSGGDPRASLREVFWSYALHGLVTEAALRGVLPAWRGLADEFREGDTRRQILGDVWLLMACRLELLRQMHQPGASPLTLEALRESLQREAGSGPPMTWDDIPLYPAEPARGFLDQGWVPDVRYDERGIAVRFPLGSIPWPLHPDSRCQLDEEQRFAVVATWALVPLPWDAASRILPALLEQPSAVVRGYALDAAWRMDLETRHEEVTRPPWLVRAVQQRASQDPHPAIQVRARQMVATLERGAPLGPSEGQGLEDICRRGGGAPPPAGRP